MPFVLYLSVILFPFFDTLLISHITHPPSMYLSITGGKLKGRGRQGRRNDTDGVEIDTWDVEVDGDGDGDGDDRGGT